MEQFKRKFLEEALELVHSLEDTLLRLEQDMDDKKTIEEVFRVMHSLKGGSAMFGFAKIDAFTHNLETIYDLIRANKFRMSVEILDLTLASVDHIKVLLESEEQLTASAEQNHKLLLGKINAIAEGGSVVVDGGEIPAIHSNPTPQEGGGEENLRTVYLKIKPGPGIFRNGTNPLLLIDELHTLGHCKVFLKTQEVPHLTDLNAEESCLAWEVILVTSQTDEDIRDVFIFVEDHCEILLHELASNNLLARAEFVSQLNERLSGSAFGEVSVLQDLASSIIQASKEVEPLLVKDSELTPAARETAISSIRVASDKLDHLMNLVSELVTTQASLSLLAESKNIPELSVIAENIEKISRQLRDNTFEICLIPIETILVRFKRLVRDLSNELKKDIQFIAEGSETELDKSIIEGLTEPLMHIFRNAIDHGIEPSDERLKKGKPRQGKIVLRAFYSGTNVYIQIKDDGRGIDVNKIRQKAIARGFISEDSNLSYKELLNLVFLPGFSTAAKVTEVSGRGVGLDVVVKKIADIRGDVEIESQLGIGTTITIKLPLTLSIIDGLLVKIDRTHFVLPLSSVDKCFEITYEQIQQAFNNKIVLDGKQVSCVNLREEFQISDNCPELQQVIQVNYDEVKVGFTVDQVIGEYQAVLKPLGRLFKDQEIISGATILGDGTIALVLDPGKIIACFDKETTHKRLIIERKILESIKN